MNSSKVVPPQLGCVGFTAFISEGFDNKDILGLWVSPVAASVTYDRSVGLLTVLGPVGDDYAYFVREITFATTSTKTQQNRIITYKYSYGTKQPILVTKNGGSPIAFAEVIFSPEAAWLTAYTLCAQRQSSLATIPDGETQAAYTRLLRGKDTTWLGATGTTTGSTARWSWNSQISNKAFYVGTSALGLVQNSLITFWAEGQPIVIPASPVLNAMMQSDGTWTAELPSSQTVTVTICSNPADPSFSDSGFVQVAIAGSLSCFGDKQCSWNSGTNMCQASSCLLNTDKAGCNAAARCYWDATTNKCYINSAACSQLSVSDCTLPQNVENCAVVNNMCINAPTCKNYPDTLSCNGDATCAFGDTSGCHNRLCGYSGFDDCVMDSFCAWSNDKCHPIACITETDQGVCTANSDCQWNNNGIPRCAPKSCTYTTSQLCLADPTCAWVSKNNGPFTCMRNLCDTFDNITCSQEPDMCEVRQVDQKCVRKSCNEPTMEQCNAKADCIWGPQTVSVNGIAVTRDICTARTFNNMQASAADQTCTEVVNDKSMLRLLLIILAGVLFLSFVWIYYRQYVAQKANVKVNFKEQEDAFGGQQLYEQPSTYEAPSPNNNNNRRGGLEEPLTQSSVTESSSEMTEEEQLDAL
jgi:hypothetical protein